MVIPSLIPRLPQNTNIYRRENLVFFLRKHDVIETGLRSCCSTNYAFNAWCVWYSTPDNCIHVVSWQLPSLFFLYAHGQLRSLYPLSAFDTAHVRENTRLSPPAQVQCLRSGAWEPGNAARSSLCQNSKMITLHSLETAAKPSNQKTIVLSFSWAAVSKAP